MNITKHMLHLMHHTLGVRPDRREPFRNHFLAGPGHHDLAALESLEQAGLMKQARTPAFCNKDDMVFVCTEAGKAYAIDNLPPEHPPKPRNNYTEFTDADSGHSFGEWLGINLPRVDCRRAAKGWEYRMYRQDRHYTWGSWGAVSGDWKPTNKEAKASYKEALKAFQTAAKAFHG